MKWTGKGEAREWDRGKVVEEAGVPAERKGEVGLEAAFGDRYRRYKARVPRWIGLPRRARTEAGRPRNFPGQ